MTKPLVALDSCSIIHLLEETPQWFAHLKQIYDDAIAGRIRIFVSEVSIAECLRLKVKGASPVSPEEAAKTLSLFFRNMFIVRRGFTSRESALAGSLIRVKGIGTCDALIGASAALAGATHLVTTDGCTHRRKDGKLLSVPEIVTDSGHRMKVEPPHATTYRDAFSPPV